MCPEVENTPDREMRSAGQGRAWLDGKTERDTSAERRKRNENENNNKDEEEEKKKEKETEKNTYRGGTRGATTRTVEFSLARPANAPADCPSPSGAARGGGGHAPSCGTGARK